MLRPLLAASLPLLLVPAAATAQQPTMPLSEVRPGMQCKGLSVVKGQDVTSFDARIEDVVAGDRGADAPRLLLRVSGPAIDETGVGQGFSGSPIVCDGRVAGAISEGIGDFGSDVVLATPIERILGEPVDPPAQRPSPAPARTRSLAQLTVTGVSGPVAAAPRQAAGGPARLVPGSAFAVGLSSGDLAASFVGTVTYTDGDRLWGFGHPLDAAGRRSLLLQEAYVYGVIGNPVATEELTTYKLAAPTRDVGTITNDGTDAVVGRTGPLPRRIALRTIATDQDTGRRRILEVQVADEAAAGQPTGQSGLAALAPISVAQAAYVTLRGTPARLTSRLCATIRLSVPKRDLKLCNRYVGGGGGAADVAGAPAAADVSDMLALIDAYDAAPLRVDRARLQLDLRRGLSLAYLDGVRGPRTARRGQRITLRLRLRRAFDGARLTRTLRLRVPADVRRGERDVVLQGTPSDDAGLGGDELDLDDLDLAPEGPVSGPRTFRELEEAVEELERWDGVRGDVLDPGEELGEDDGRRVLLDRDVRIAGDARLTIRVR